MTSSFTLALLAAVTVAALGIDWMRAERLKRRLRDQSDPASESAAHAHADQRAQRRETARAEAFVHGRQTPVASHATGPGGL
ncbi:hypothetical protein [Nocardioides sp. Leaf285]|uniref:hypothetical protein n=1 Tax=Nocardioides sp. Leaf285 TaxID=1736322 RepID=UPI000703BF44|nr:hypothetical protein [Nocardioides sp. Leaf285]KQP63139.1 hypothetical protein ASF47_19205 [Nocardioides sp. Leaf285]